jgi:hypothetical protein
MRPYVAPYERLGRYFVAYQAQLNINLAADDCSRRHLYDNLSTLTLGFSALPKWLQDRMLAEYADYVVSNLLVWVRGKSLCSLWSKLLKKERVLFSLLTHKYFHFGYSSATQSYTSITFPRYAPKISFQKLTIRAEQDNILTHSLKYYGLDDARQCMQKVCEVAGLLGRDEDDVECVLFRDAVSRDLFETLLPKMRSLEAQGGTGRAACNTWISTLGVLLTSKERETYGIASE